MVGALHSGLKDAFLFGRLRAGRPMPAAGRPTSLQQKCS